MSGDDRPPFLRPSTGEELREGDPTSPVYAERLSRREGGPVTDLAGVERRVSALERHLFDPCETSDPSEAPEENADKPYAGKLASGELHIEDPLTLVGGSAVGPGYIIGDRADRAAALLGTVETIKATGGAVETHGVRIEPCDEYGRTATTKLLEHTLHARDRAEQRLGASRREITALLEKLESAEKEIGRLDRAVHDLGMALIHTREYVEPSITLPAVEGWSWYDALRTHAPGLLPTEAENGEEIGENRQAPPLDLARDRDQARATAEALAAKVMYEAARRLELVRDTVRRADTARLDGIQTRSAVRAAADGADPWPDAEAPWSGDEEIGRGLIRCGEKRLADVAEGRTALVECELPDGHAEPHHAGRRHAVTW